MRERHCQRDSREHRQAPFHSWPFSAALATYSTRHFHKALEMGIQGWQATWLACRSLAQLTLPASPLFITGHPIPPTPLAILPYQGDPGLTVSTESRLLEDFFSVHPSLLQASRRLSPIQAMDGWRRAIIQSPSNPGTKRLRKRLTRLDHFADTLFVCVNHYGTTLWPNPVDTPPPSPLISPSPLIFFARTTRCCSNRLRLLQRDHALQITLNNFPISPAIRCLLRGR